MIKFKSLMLAAAAVGVFGLSDLPAQSTTPPSPMPDSAGEQKPASPSSSGSSSKSKLETLTDGMTKVEGMWTMYHNDQKLLVLLKPGDLNKNFIVLTSIARGISSGYVLGGMSWGFGDDVLWSFRKVGEKIHVVRRNVRFKANPGTPESDAVKLAYSDSVLYALPILTSASGGQLVDMSRIFMSDDQKIGQSIGFTFSPDRSTWSQVKAFPKNVELQVAAIYSGSRPLDTVADSRGAQVNVHYSISELPTNGYKPRVADDRIGYFLSVIKNFSDTDDDQHFVRYINRWDLKKKDPNASLSPPEEPIIFYMEKTVPIRLRPYVKAGIEEWNKAFEKVGFADAIQVRQQRDDDNWDPEDVRYNTFRWITAEAGFAMGPSRVNPMTGQILDADIIFDASFLRYWKTDYETFTPEKARALMGGTYGWEDVPQPFRKQHADYFADAADHRHHARHGHQPHASCTLCTGMQHQMGFSAAALMGQGLASPKGELPDEFIHQALKEVVMHEVGHTLGLRHNFKASSWKSLEEISDPNYNGPTVASVMDYTPANILIEKAKQGAYYSNTIGPYDHWAIEYGYKPISGDEKAELAKIAARSNEPGHAYATDEDTRSFDSDPLSNRFDLGTSPIEFAARQMKLSTELLPNVVERSVKEGDGYQRARQAFGMLFSEYWRTAYFASRFPGGIHVHRTHKGDADEKPPFQVVDVEQQRAAMKLLAETVFESPSYDPNVLNHLAATRWSHWGLRSQARLDYPIHDFVGMMQDRILDQLLNSITLGRLHDNEIKVAADADAYTLAEHLKTLIEGVFTEWKDGKAGEYTNRTPYVSSFRRNLQRMALKRMADLVTRPSGAPDDARMLARMHLTDLDNQITALLKKRDVKLDDYTRAHLQDSQSRIRQVLNAQLGVSSVN